jgi:hypothetical protein
LAWASLARGDDDGGGHDGGGNVGLAAQAHSGAADAIPYFTWGIAALIACGVLANVIGHRRGATFFGPARAGFGQGPYVDHLYLPCAVAHAATPTQVRVAFLRAIGLRSATVILEERVERGAGLVLNLGSLPQFPCKEAPLAARAVKVRDVGAGEKGYLVDLAFSMEDGAKRAELAAFVQRLGDTATSGARS